MLVESHFTNMQRAAIYERIPFEHVFSFSREFRVDKQSLVTQQGYRMRMDCCGIKSK
jgi:hypothetical protein